MNNGFYVNETTRARNTETGIEWITRYFVHFDSPYRLGCYISECTSRRQANALAAALNATLDLRGQ